MIGMGKYDSILKEKKKTTTIEEQPKKFPKFLVSCILIIIVLISSYIIYYNKVLSPKNIVIQDSINIVKKYSSLIKNAPLLEFKNENNLTGTIIYGPDTFNFNLVKNNNNLSFNISNNNKFINYYLLDNKTYIKVPSITEYISLNSNFSINTLLSLEEKLSTIKEDKYIKNIYFANKKPIVEINLTLNTNELNEIFGFGLEEEYEVIATFKNNAIINNIEETKIIINNKTTLERKVITIKENELLYKINNDTYKMILESKDNNFTLKINKNDILYSVLTGTTNESNYIYTYQVYLSESSDYIEYPTFNTQITTDTETYQVNGPNTTIDSIGDYYTVTTLLQNQNNTYAYNNKPCFISPKV